MDYKRLAMEDLRTHQQRVDALRNLQEKLTALSAQLTALKSPSADAIPVQGGASRSEERIIDNMAERERLKLNYKTVKALVDIVERGLTSLTESERHILTEFAKAGRHDKGTADMLADQMHMDRSTVYRIRDAALQKFTRSCYGIIDL